MKYVKQPNGLYELTSNFRTFRKAAQKYAIITIFDTIVRFRMSIKTKIVWLCSFNLQFLCYIVFPSVQLLHHPHLALHTWLTLWLSVVSLIGLSSISLFVCLFALPSIESFARSCGFCVLCSCFASLPLAHTGRLSNCCIRIQSINYATARPLLLHNSRVTLARKAETKVDCGPQARNSFGRPLEFAEIFDSQFCRRYTFQNEKNSLYSIDCNALG